MVFRSWRGRRGNSGLKFVRQIRERVRIKSILIGKTHLNEKHKNEVSDLVLKHKLEAEIVGNDEQLRS